MTVKNSSVKNSAVLFITLLFVYVVLFEFILPVNKILPKPTLMAESFFHVWRDYNLVYAFTISSTVIYLMLFLGFILVYFSIVWIIKAMVELKPTILSFRLFKYLPAFFFAVVFNFWFADILLGEFIFALTLVLLLIFKKLFEESKNIKDEYLVVARNLNMPTSKIYKNIYWKFSLPALSEYTKQIHYYLWVLVLVYEFIGNSFGLGSIYRQALAYNDFTALFTLALLIALLIWFGNYLIALITKNLIHWGA